MSLENIFKKTQKDFTNLLLSVILQNDAIHEKGVTMEDLENAVKVLDLEKPKKSKPPKPEKEPKPPKVIDPETQCQRIKAGKRCTGKQKTEKVFDSDMIFKVCEQCNKVKSCTPEEFVQVKGQNGLFCTVEDSVPEKPEKVKPEKVIDPATQCQRLKAGKRCTGKQKTEKVFDAAHVFKVCDQCFRVKSAKVTDYVQDTVEDTSFPDILQ